MRVKNRIIEQLDERIRTEYYEILDEHTPLYLAKAGVPIRTNTEVCGDGFLVIRPRSEQQSYCIGRVMSLYDLLPDMRDQAELIEGVPKEQAVDYLTRIVQEQYDPKEVYDFLMQGLREQTLRNVIDFETIKEFSDKGTGRDISIYHVYHEGRWHCISCCVMGYEEHSIKALDYSLENNYKRAVTYFSKHLSGKDKQAFDNMMTSEAEM